MADRLFPLDEIPEVPLLRVPRGSRGPQISDERLGHDYPPEWHRCQTCDGPGFRWSRDGGKSFADPNTHASPDTIQGVGNNEGTWEKITCGECLGMGSLKARVRLEAGHRCVRCGWRVFHAEVLCRRCARAHRR